MAPMPLVGLSTDSFDDDEHPSFSTGEDYVLAVLHAAKAIPLLLPSIEPMLPLRDLLERLDGLLLTGATSNVEPHHYTDEASYEGNLHDRARDQTTLALLPLALEMGVPVLALCRGFQEVNVAFGGTLHQKVHEQSELMDHREDPQDPLEKQYGPAHEVRFHKDGLLANIAGVESLMVNSLHGQGVDRLAKGLKVEATAPDGLVEAFRHGESPFLLGVQWHPEWKFAENDFNRGLFEAFGDACRARAAQRGNGRAA